MGRKTKDKKKGKGAEKTAAKTEKKQLNKLRKELKAKGEDDIETIVANLEREEMKQKQVMEKVIDKPNRRVHFSFIPHPDKDELILFGGEFFNGRETILYNDLLFYNIPNNRWTLVKAPGGPPPRSAHQMVGSSANGGELWLFGGEFASSSQSQFHHYRDLWVYNLSSKIWKQIKAPNGPRAMSGHRMIMSKNKIFLFGGFNDSLTSYTYFNNMYCFDTSSYKWSQLEISGNPPSPRSGCCMAALPDGKIFIYGGYSKEQLRKDIDKGVVHDDAFTLTPLKSESKGASHKWVRTKVGGFSFTRRCSMQMATVGSKAYCFGGVFDIEDQEEDINGTFFNDLLCLDLENFMWRNITLSGKKKPKTKRRKPKDGGDESEDESEEESKDVEMLSEVVKEATIADDGIFKVTVGPAPVASSSALGEAQVEKEKLFQPSPRMNAGIAIKKGILYLYGGMYEDAEKEITFNDLYALDIRKLDEWKVLLTDEKPQAEWVGDDSSDSDMDAESDDDLSDEDEESSEEESDENNSKKEDSPMDLN